jgi:hypothetical protein
LRLIQAKLRSTTIRLGKTPTPLRGMGSFYDLKLPIPRAGDDDDHLLAAIEVAGEDAPDEMETAPGTAARRRPSRSWISAGCMPIV